MRTSIVSRSRIIATMIMLSVTAACGSADDRAVDADAANRTPNETASVSSTGSTPTPVATTSPVAAGAPTESAPGMSQPRSCAAEIGGAAARKRVAVCRDVSPATRPPCNAANSCALIEDEIARSCALFDGRGAPMEGCTPAPKSMEAAADVVRRYYSAIDARDYATAWQQWGDDGRPGQTFAAFKAGFARTRLTSVSIGTLTPGDGGAGSIYQPVPVIVDATLDDGTHQRFRGTYVVRRVNGVDGATSAQLRWHLDSAKLAPIK